MMRGSSSGRGDFRPVYHPAGHDSDLRAVLQDLRAGRWMSMRKLLGRTGADWALRTARTQVLAAATAGSDVVQTWRAEDPGSVDALVMYARVAVERAVRARRDSHARTGELGRRRGRSAGTRPTPRRATRALGLPTGPGPARRPARASRTPAGPGGPDARPRTVGLLQEVHARDPYNREAYHRVLQFVYALEGGPMAQAQYFAEWVTERAPQGSPLLLLPLYVHAERYRVERGHERALDLHWIRQDAIGHVQRALQGWFDHSNPATRSTLDLNYLAHALWSVHQFADAARVFEAVGPYLTPVPWAYHTPTPAP
ncbi:hypothetical protein NKH77_31410 [Streptomyces sp. M19]